MAERELRVLWLYPDHMNIYADRGNIAVLERRCAWRGIGFALSARGPGDRIDPDAHELLYIGGGQDRDQALVAHDLVETKREAIAAAARPRCRDARGLRRLPAARPLLRARRTASRCPASASSTCARCGSRAAPDRQRRDRGRPRRRAAAASPASRTTAAAPISVPRRRRSARVVSGFGNNGKDGHEGVRRGRLIGTYLHGPLLPKNAWLADRADRVGARARGYGESRRWSRSTTASRTRAHDCAVRAGASAARLGVSGRSSRSRPRRARLSVSSSDLLELRRLDARPPRAGRCGRRARSRTALARSVFSSSTRSSPR